MNSTQCVAKVLQKIIENIDSIQPGESVTHLIDSVSKIGRFALKKSLPCSLLKDVILIVNKYQPYCNSSLASAFLNEVYHFYKDENLCLNFKLAILTCFKPAVEVEVLALLNICLGINCVEELDRVKSAVSNSCLPMACAENPDMLHKVNCTLKESMTVTNGNPVVGYLSFIFNKTVKNCSKSSCNLCLLPENVFHLEILFSVPQEFFCQSQQIFYVEQVMSSLVETVNQNICKRNDLVYLSAIYPSVFYQILTFHKNEAFDAYKFLRIFYDIDSNALWSDLKIDLHNILKNPVWAYLLDNYVLK